ncbi:MAG: hypothetical protein HQM10_16460 [Candidatus Riflebacteria bacterium]|nr:hypothetical protein [Candidatus Riflebacteria bacterium]
MKKMRYFLILVFISGIVIFPFMSKYGIRVGNWTMPFDADRMYIYESTLEFLESVKYKDFKTAASFHHPDKFKERDVPKLIESRFFVKPELLDLANHEVLHVDVNSRGDRARARCRATVKVLNTKEIRDLDIIFYWMKESSKWYMTLESSL